MSRVRGGVGGGVGDGGSGVEGGRVRRWSEEAEWWWKGCSDGVEEVEGE